MSIEIQTEEQAGPYPRWPRKVQELQEMMDVRWEVADDSSYISATLPLQHRRFHESNITFLPLAAKDDSGRVWTSILAGRDGRPGFVKSPNPRLLQVVAEPPEGDPAWRTLPHGAEKSVAGVGVETTTRRRNKVGGEFPTRRDGRARRQPSSPLTLIGPQVKLTSNGVERSCISISPSPKRWGESIQARIVRF